MIDGTSYIYIYMSLRKENTTVGRLAAELPIDPKARMSNIEG